MLSILAIFFPTGESVLYNLVVFFVALSVQVSVVAPTVVFYFSSTPQKRIYERVGKHGPQTQPTNPQTTTNQGGTAYAGGGTRAARRTHCGCRAKHRGLGPKKGSGGRTQKRCARGRRWTTNTVMERERGLRRRPMVVPGSGWRWQWQWR